MIRAPASPYPEAVTAKATGGALLLVEDDDSIGRLVKQYLEQQDGWRVVWRRTGEEALAELRASPCGSSFSTSVCRAWTASRSAA